MRGKERAVRLAIVVPTHWAYFMGGSQFQAQILIEALQRRGGVDPAYFAARLPDDTAALDQKVFRSGTAVKLRRFGHFWDYFSLQRQLGAFRPDAIYQRVCCSHTGICARYAVRNEIPLIWHVASDRDCQKRPGLLRQIPRPHRYIESRLSEYGMRRAKYVVAQTGTQANLLRRNFGIEAKAVIRNFHPIPSEAVDKSGTFTVLWIANLKSVKRPDLFIKVANLIQSSEPIRFRMIGSPYVDKQVHAKFMSAVAESGKIEFLGRLTQAEVNAELRKAHLLVNTSAAEGFSNTFIQAWMRHVPVVTIGVNPDGIFDDGALGRCCDTAEAAAEFIMEFAGNLELRSQMALTAYDRSTSIFSMRNAEDLVDLILDAVASNREHKSGKKSA